jgi:hypothetical protein
MTILNDQYDYMFKRPEKERLMGVVASSTWERDPKRLLFTLSRYKFVAKMFDGFERVLEVGCGDAWASRVVRQHVKELKAIDIDERFITSAVDYSTGTWQIDIAPLDISNTTSDIEKYDGIYFLDVLEHIHPSEERKFLESVCRLMHDSSVAIIGMPTLRSQSLIPDQKRDKGHVNCKEPQDLKVMLSNYFKNVFIFSMNDEVIHTGNFDMTHYVFAMCCGKR